MREMKVRIDLASEQMEEAGEKIPLSATVGPRSPEGQSAAEMSVAERRTEQEAREEPPLAREWTAEKAY
jgi:hypothetical protein